MKFPIRGWGLCNCQQNIAFDESYILRMLDEASLNDINYIELIGPYYNQPERCPIDSLVTYREFPELNRSNSMKRDLGYIKNENAKFNRICSQAKRLGIAITVWFHELWFPKDILIFYPEMDDGKGNVVYSSDAFQRFFRSKFTELFETIPDLSGLVLTTCESLVLNILNLPSECDRQLSKYEAYTHMLNTIADICKQYEKDLYVRMFGLNNPEKFYAICEAFKKVDPMVRIHQKSCDHGDWQNIFQKANDRHGAFGDRLEIVEEEIGLEHFGLGKFPLVYIDVLRHRAVNCKNRGVKGMVARVDRMENRSWDHEAQLNVIVFTQLLQNPEADMSSVVWEWAKQYYGGAYSCALKALEQGASIFHDMTYVYPGEDEKRFRRGKWIPMPVAMDEQYGIFGALRETGGYRTPKELAVVRCERMVQELHYGEQYLDGCTQQQREHYTQLQAKFKNLLQYGKERLAVLDVYKAFGDLFFSASNILKNSDRFNKVVQAYREQFPRGQYDEDIKMMIKILHSCKKVDVNVYGGYVCAGDL